MASTQLTGREYKRVSLDKSKRARSVEEQGKENAAAAEERGIVLRDPYTDVDRSASRYARKAREGFDQLLADLRDGTFNADFLILWESSRGSRKVGEWCELVDLLEKRHIQVLVTSHRRVYDPAVARDRKALLEDALDAQYESDKSSERCRRAHAANAEAGRPHGPVAWGFTRRYDPVTKAFVSQDIDETQAPMIRELFERLEAGHSLNSIAVDFERRGLVGRNGRPWRAAHLRELALRPVYAGLRQHQPKGQDRAVLTSAVWPAIVPLERFLAVQRLLTASERKSTRPGRAAHFLSLIAICDTCSGPLTAITRDGDRFYRCQRKGCVRIGEDELDRLVAGVIKAWVRQHYDSLTVTADDDTELADVRAKLARAHAELRELEDEVKSGRLSARFAAATAPGIEERITRLEQQEKDLLTPGELAGLITPGEDIEECWKNMPLPAKRRVARLVLVPGRIGQVRVQAVSAGRRGGGRHVPAWERVDFSRG
jgi:DNA invertase Pin-like site-specific DNA recombinase